MQASNSISRALGTWVIAAGCTLSAFSGPLKLIEHKINIPERGAVTGYLISLETNHFSFLPPSLWRTSHKPGGNSIAIMSPDLTSGISIEFIERNTDEPAPKPAALIKQRFAGAATNEPFEFHTGFGPVLAHDLHRKAGDNVRLTSRVIYVVTRAAIIEFALTAPVAKFEEYTIAFANVVNSFRPTRHYLPCRYGTVIALRLRRCMPSRLLPKKALKARPLVVIDLSERMTRAIGLQWIGEDFAVRDYSFIEAPGLLSNMTRGELAAHLRTLVGSLRTKCRNAVLVLGMQDVLVRWLELPRSHDTGFPAIAKLNTAKYFP